MVSAIVGAVVYRTDGAARGDIIAAFLVAPERSQVQRWLTDMVAAEILDAETSGGRRRYVARPNAVADVRTGKSAAPAAPAAAVVADTSAAVEPGKLEAPQRAQTDLSAKRGDRRGERDFRLRRAYGGQGSPGSRGAKRGRSRDFRDVERD